VTRDEFDDALDAVTAAAIGTRSQRREHTRSRSVWLGSRQQNALPGADEEICRLACHGPDQIQASQFCVDS
jgi:hypothetical protein